MSHFSLRGITAISDVRSPIQHLVLSKSSGDVAADRQTFDRIAEHCMSKGVFVTQARYIEKFEMKTPLPR